MSAALAVAAAVIFTWLGAVLAISFLEAPLKFRAPDVTIRIGLGIGRLVFRALNTVEVVLAGVLIAALVLAAPGIAVAAGAAVTIAVLALQLALIRPRLSRRSDAVLAGQDAPRSRAHYAYIAAEGVKVIALVATGVVILSS
ncbi:MAG TPA: hypothetical protein VK095_09705 [Beutenbergiaceae bacterium]|nr:hypothetical protein [Beutenbergiaceae bacterium]